jgi:hypothetical protein
VPKKATADLTNFGKMMAIPISPSTQYDDTQRKAVEAGVKAQGGPPLPRSTSGSARAFSPRRGRCDPRSLVSTDPRMPSDSGQYRRQHAHRNPNAFAGVEGQSDIEHAAVAFNHYVFDLGIAPELRLQRVAQENDPKFKEKVKFTDPQRQEAMKQLRQNGGAQAETSFQRSGSPIPKRKEEGQPDLSRADYDNLARGLDLGGAQAQAAAQLRKVYGVNKNGRIVKYAPEAIYPAIGGSPTITSTRRWKDGEAGDRAHSAVGQPRSDPRRDR